MHIASMAAAMATEWAREPSQSRRDPPSDGVVLDFMESTNQMHHILYNTLTVYFVQYLVVLKPYGQFISSILFHMQARQRDGAQYEKRKLVRRCCAGGLWLVH